MLETPHLKNVKSRGAGGWWVVCCLLWFYVCCQCMFVAVDVFQGRVFGGKILKSVQCFRVIG